MMPKNRRPKNTPKMMNRVRCVAGDLPENTLVESLWEYNCNRIDRERSLKIQH